MWEINSLQNPKIKRAAKLIDRRAREKDQKFLIEGYRELLHAQKGKQPIDEIYYCNNFLGQEEKAFIENLKKNGTKVFQLSPEVFRKISYRERPDGLIALAPIIHKQIEDLTILQKERENPLYIVAEGLEKPGNLGTILRSSDAAGATALILADRLTDIHNPNVIRASVGTVFTVPVIECAGDQAISWLKNNDVQIIAATPDAVTEYTEVNLIGPVAIAIGTEHQGLSSEWLNAADIQVKIPMLGYADSLNAAMAATILMFEVRRQRRIISHG
jgi:TrmH family RNA methyltransferase